jgi:hypothetical protein
LQHLTETPKLYTLGQPNSAGAVAFNLGGNDDFVGLVVNRSVWNPVHPNDQVTTTQVLLDGGTRNGTATIRWN